MIPLVLCQREAQLTGINTPLFNTEHKYRNITGSAHTVWSPINKEPSTFLYILTFREADDAHEVSTIVFREFPHAHTCLNGKRIKVLEFADIIVFEIHFEIVLTTKLRHIHQ